MAEYKQMSIYFDLKKPDEAWTYQYLMSLRHGKKAMVITALKRMLGKGEQAAAFSVQAMQLPPKGAGIPGKKGNDRRKAFGHPVQEGYLDAECVGDGTKEESGVRPEREKPLKTPLPEEREDLAQKDGKLEPDWRTFFTQEQLAAILEKKLDMSQLTEDGIRQMAGQVQNGIPVRAAYKEALMWCQ